MNLNEYKNSYNALQKVLEAKNKRIRELEDTIGLYSIDTTRPYAVTEGEKLIKIVQNYVNHSMTNWKVTNAECDGCNIECPKVK